MTHETSSLLQAGLRWFAEGRQVAVATVIKTWGSSPRPVGSLLLVSEQGDFVGSVSGGCIEGAVISAAQKTMRDGISQLLSYGVTQDMAWEVGLSCGGRIEIFVEQADSSLIARLADSMTLRKPQLVVTELTEAPFSLATKLHLTTPDDPLCPPFLRQFVEAAFESDVPSEVLTDDHRRFFLQPFLPLPRLLLVGAVHISQSLVPMATLCGMDVMVIDPRTQFASADRFPGVTLVTAWPDVALSSLPSLRRTAVVALTHDPKLDDPAIEAALRGDAFFVGALGSRKTHAARLTRLAERGVSQELLSRIRGPVGLPIGARSPSEIAVSILAQVIEALHTDTKESPAKTTEKGEP